MLYKKGIERARSLKGESVCCDYAVMCKAAEKGEAYTTCDAGLGYEALEEMQATKQISNEPRPRYVCNTFVINTHLSVTNKRL